MTDRLPSPPAPLPSPDRTQLERLNRLHDFAVDATARGWGTPFVNRARAVLARILSRQREFNAALVEHINRNDQVGIAAHHASADINAWLLRVLQDVSDKVDGYAEELRMHQRALSAWERRSAGAVETLSGTHAEMRTSIGVLQQAVQNLKREMTRVAASGAGAGRPAEAAAPHAQADALESHKYVGFEDQFRGAPDDIRRRVSEYLPLFTGAQQVLDVGCGRGEFLELLRTEGISARGIDVNAAMVEVCRQHGLAVEEADALTYLREQPDASLGGIFAAQVVEHLEPRYLTAFLDVAFDKLRPGAPIVLETINPACWFAFFESYIRDITHVRPLHPDTLQYLLIATGFQQVDIRYRAPYPEHEKLQPLPPAAALGDSIETLNANVERLNSLLFTFLDYAAIGRRP
jgi:2-polyprenyl-3-methyl-5-hydroxy-6-metoxy-1,4-benzoquinol methylase